MCPPRKIPIVLRVRVKQKLSRMEKMGVVVNVDEPTEWVNLIVLVEKPGRKQIRICQDIRILN